MEILHFLPLIDRLIDFHLILIIRNSVLLNLIQSFRLIGMPIVSLTCQNRSCISKLISEYKLYQLNHNLILLTILTEKVTIKRVMQINNIMVLIFITCAVISHLFFTLLSMSVMPQPVKIRQT